jgi:hypothetical protein
MEGKNREREKHGITRKGGRSKQKERRTVRPGKGNEKKSENDKVFSSVADPDPSDPFVLGLLDPEPLVRGMDPDPAPSIIKQK